MTDASPRLILLVHLAATLFMVGLIWFVQVVHYPLFDRADRLDFRAFAQSHANRTAFVVGPPMLVELATALLLLAVRPAGVPAWQPWVGMGLLLVVWLSTAFIQVPCHEALSDGYDAAIVERLVTTNWLRTLAWTLRGLLALRMAWEAGG